MFNVGLALKEYPDLYSVVNVCWMPLADVPGQAVATLKFRVFNCL